jgi:heme exporter protein A
MLTLSHISCTRGHKPLFAEVNLDLHAGQALHLEGDNGVGKTSLLRIVCGLSPADTGEVRWMGHPTRDDPAAFRAALFYLGHALSLKEELTALENLLSDAAVAGRALTQPQALAALARMGLRGREHLPLRVMSQGQKRRTALARLWASQSPLWVLDEPFVALDVKAVDALRVLMADHLAQGGMVLFTSHQAVSLARADGTPVAVQRHRLEAAP